MELEELKKKTLILAQTEPDSDFIFCTWIERGYSADILFQPQIKLIRALRRIWIKCKFPMQSIWYGKWKEELNEYNTIILHASSLVLDIPKWIHKKYPDMRIIMWYWNRVYEGTIPDKISDLQVECWSFDFDDCKKYDMKNNVQYYCMPEKMSGEQEKKDIYFVGLDVGRREQIEKIREVAEKQNLSCDFHIIKNKTYAIPYREIQRDILKCKAILEINREGQSGYTLRVMESLFFDKKLITNNEAVLQAPFYKKSNIYIIKDEKLEGLKEFLEVPYDKSVSIYKEDYTMEAWFLNFFR